ncbi:hypothetical protein WG66_004996, partial [Moniliophthora roreri]
LSLTIPHYLVELDKCDAPSHETIISEVSPLSQTTIQYYEGTKTIGLETRKEIACMRSRCIIIYWSCCQLIVIGTAFVSRYKGADLDQ